MSDSTARLGLPFLMPAQAQKHVTVNEALARLDALVGASVESRSSVTQPADPDEGATYILPPGAAGEDWADFAATDLVHFVDGAWTRIAARPGLTAYVADEGALVIFDGDDWVPFADAIATLANLQSLGVGTAPDAANPFAAKLNAALWTARFIGEGGTGDLRYTLNKEAADGTLSFLFQSGWSGRAEIGLAGSDDLSVKVSPDGLAWTEAMRIARGTGSVGLPRAVVSAESLNGDAIGGFRNLVVNGCCRVWQRGDIVTLEGTGYAADRFMASFTGSGGMTVSRLTLGGGEGIDGNPRSALRLDPTGLSGSIYYRPTWKLGQEALLKTAGRRCVLSFWARAGEATSMEVMLARRLGSGGSPAEFPSHGMVTLTPAWNRFTVIVDLDDLSGRTLGEGYSLEVFLNRAGASFPETVDFTNVQFELAAPGQTFASPFECRGEAVERVLCRRHFERVEVSASGVFAAGYFESATSFQTFLRFAQKRAAPSLTFADPGDFEVLRSGATAAVTGVAGGSINPSAARLSVTLATGGAEGEAGLLRAGAQGAHIDISAEI